jgi:hypothetical protein
MHCKRSTLAPTSLSPKALRPVAMAAGGIADGRGLAAALALGAEAPVAGGIAEQLICCNPIIRTNALQEQETAIRISAVRNQMRRFRRNPVATADRKPSCREIRLACGNCKDPFQDEVMVSALPMIMPRDSLAGRKREFARLYVNALYNRLHAFDFVTR